VAAATVMLALPLVKLAEGVNTALRVRPVPLMALRVPLSKLISPRLPFQEKLLPGSSEKVNVISAVWPFRSAAVLDPMLTLGL
jgi:hypothetical protein